VQPELGGTEETMFGRLIQFTVFLLVFSFHLNLWDNALGLRKRDLPVWPKRHWCFA